MQEVTAEEFRRTMARFATGVTVVATSDPRTGAPRGCTVNAICSVSLEPPLVLACISNGGSTVAAIRASGHFSVNVLAEEQQDLSARFARRSSCDRFEDVPYYRGQGGAPLLNDALATLECSVWASYPGGDHTIFVGQVLGATRGTGQGNPLLFFGGDYSRIADSEFGLATTWSADGDR